MYEKKEIVEKLLKRIKGVIVPGSEIERVAHAAYEYGVEFRNTHRVTASQRYHIYKMYLPDGTSVSSSNYLDAYLTRRQTKAYIEAETIVKEFFEDPKEKLFRLVRDQRRYINNAFKAEISQKEPQQIDYIDYVLVIACFAAGYMNHED